MECGAHLPLIGPPRRLAELTAYARAASALGYRYLCANDHLLFQTPWLDGPTALAATLEASGDMTLATTVLLPVIRGAQASAKLLEALQQLSGGRVLTGVGPGSSARDYAAVGVPFTERWRRFDAVVAELRTLVDVPLWIASWGSPAGLGRVRRLGDGWLASAYNTTPAAFAEARAAVALPHALATTWLYVTESRREAERARAQLAALVRRPAEALATLPIGSAEHCAEQLSAFGAERVFVWPLADELRQLEIFRVQVVPRIVSVGR
jgi:alkanesulfonate monooxygenase SsuD/methylene tetrahydromethanopterin reductase-like flavin-dependent oxidoreductase (luciferase family)